MKKLYKKLMKTSVLICLLLLGTGNAWGEKVWYSSKYDGTTGGSTYGGRMMANSKTSIGTTEQLVYGSYTGDDYQTNNIYIWADSQTKLPDKKASYLGVPFDNNKLYLKPQGNCKAILLRLTKTASESITVNISGTDGMNEDYEISVNRGTSSQSNIGNMIVFEVTADKTYTVSSSSIFYLSNVTYVDTNDIIELDEATTGNITKIGTKKNYVKLNRTLSKEYWNTFCLPIIISEQSMQNQMRCSASYLLKNYDESSSTIEFESSTTIPANKPCLVKPSKNLTNPIFASNTAGKQNNASGSFYNESTLTASDENEKLKFVGVYEPTDIYTNDHSKFYLNNDGYLVYPTSNAGNNGKIKGFRAYFEWTGGSSGVKDMTFVFDDSETTGIKTVEHDIFGENGRVYSIDGRYMGDSTDNLSRGIYIQNGRKFVVK